MGGCQAADLRVNEASRESPSDRAGPGRVIDGRVSVLARTHVSPARQHSPTRPCWQTNPLLLPLPTYREGRRSLLLCEAFFGPKSDISCLGSHTCFDVCVGDLAGPET
jgi:hypothetical protein